MFRKYLYILITRLQKTPKEKIILNLMLLSVIQISIYLGIELVVRRYQEALNPILVLFGAIMGTISFMFMDKREIVFFERVIRDFNALKFKLGLALNINLVLMLDIMVMLYLMKKPVMNVIFVPIGFGLYPLILKYLLAFNRENKTIKGVLNCLPIDLEKEIKLFLKGTYFQVFLLVYLVAFFIKVNSVETMFFMSIIVCFAYHDTFVLNCIGIEQQELNFLRKEGFLSLSHLKRKFNFWFIIGFILFLILILEKSLRLNQLSIWYIISLTSFYVLNFVGALYLAISKAESKIGYYKVKISSLYLEFVFCFAYLVLFYFLGALIFLVNVCLIFYVYKKIPQLIDKEFNFENSPE